MALTGVKSAEADATSSGIQNAVNIAHRASEGNLTGPLTAALTFVRLYLIRKLHSVNLCLQIPMLTRTSASPSVLLVSSVAAIIPAPTRGLYCSTKASSLLLYQALAIEHPNIAFSFVLPATIEGNFRASAVDAGPVREADPNKHGLRTSYVARRCIQAVDRGVRGNIVLPWFPYALAHWLYWLWPSFIEQQARKKYNF